MFITLLFVTLIISLVMSFIVSFFFNKPMDGILKRIIADDISQAWLKYMTFAIYVVGISSGVRIWELERYITAPAYQPESKILELTQERWVLEVYRTLIGSLEGIAWLLLTFFIFALLAFVIVRIFELRRGPAPTTIATPASEQSLLTK